MSVTFNTIGKVIIENGQSYIELEEKYFEATLGLDEYSHILAVWWFNLYDSEEARNYFVMKKPYINGPNEVGVLASRSPIRPNPIAITACTLIELDKEKHRLKVGYIDAEEGTPVLDIKPYHPSIDKVRDVKMPKWCGHWPNCIEANEGFDWNKELNFPE